MPGSPASAEPAPRAGAAAPPTFQPAPAGPRELLAAPSIGITLNSVPDTSVDTSFTGCLVGSGCSSFMLDDDADPSLPKTASAESLPQGTYTITQDPVAAGSTLAISCTQGAAVDLGARRATIVLQGNESVSCTFTIQSVSLSVRHTTTPSTPTQAFDYTGCLGSGCTDFTLDGTSAAPYPNQAIAAVAPGTYTITQDPVAGWAVAGITCTGATSSIVDLPSRRVTVVVGSVNSVACTFDLRMSSLSINLDSLPGGPQDFTFTGCRVGAGCSDFVLDDDRDPSHSDAFTTTDLVPGTYTITMAAVPGWDLRSIACFGNGSWSNDMPARRVTVDIGPTSGVRCYFTTRTTGITIVQSTVGNDPQDFSFSGCAGSGCGAFTLDADPASALPGSATSVGLAPGTYTITQDVVGAFPLDDITCSTSESVDVAQRQVTITLAAFENVSCTFDNGTPRLTLVQDSVPDSPQDVGFVTCHLATGCGHVTLDDDADPTLPNSVTATDLAPGTYRLTQPYADGLTRPSVSCTGDGEQPFADGVIVTLTRTRTCTFTNNPAGPPVDDAVQVSVTERLGCARTATAGVRCWGSDSPSAGSSLAGVLTDGADQPVADVAEVAVNGGYFGGTFGCYRTTGAEVRCWGSNQYGQLGDGSDQRRDHPVAVLAPSGPGSLGDVAQLSVGTLHSCAVLTSGQARCWGHNGFGQLGDSTFTTRYRPVTVSNPDGSGPLTGVARISAGNSSTCAVLTDGQVRCWGSGQLGDGVDGASPRPRVVSDPGGTGPLTGATDINLAASPATSTPSVRACAVLESGEAACWGATTLPVPVVGEDGTGRLADVVEISVGPGHTCARLAGGQARCWGSQTGGLLGDGVITNTSVDRPRVVLGPDGTSPLTGLVSIDDGWDATCAAAEDGHAWCWGQSLYRALGIGTTAPWPYAVAVLSRP